MCLIMLDLSTAFDSLEHSLILTRLKYRFGITDTCLEWFEDYLTGRISEWLSQTVMEFMPNPPNEHLDRVYPKEVSLNQLSSISSSVHLEKYVANMEYHS